MSVVLIKNVTVITPQHVLPEHSILLDGGKIISVLPVKQMTVEKIDKIIDGQNSFALPGLIDEHIHGFAGYGPELATPEGLLQMSKALARQGICAFCPTIYSMAPEKLEILLKKLTPALGQEKGARILGFHLEGPFISPEKLGAMKQKDIAVPNVTILEQLYNAAHGKITQITLAPELPGVKSVIDFCLRHHILVQAGHTNATYEQFCHGIDLGITHVTHVFNAMRAFNHREPGTAGAVLMRADVSCEMIADGFHVHPQVISFLKTVKRIEQLVLVTDALTPTGQMNGPFLANQDSVALERGVWCRTRDHVITGSALTMEQGIKNLISWGYSLPQAVQCASTNPARLLCQQNRGQIAPGFCADITLLNVDFSPKATLIDGELFL